MVCVGINLGVEGGKYFDIVRYAFGIGCSCLQFFIRKSFGDLDSNEVKRIRNFIEENDIKIFGHGHVNLARDIERNKVMLDYFISGVELLKSFGVENVVVHVGKAIGISSEEAKLNVCKSIRYILEKTFGVRILLENTPGAYGDLGFSLEGLREIYDLFSEEEKVRIGFCLDSCHFFVAGYDFREDDIFERWVGDVERFLGWENVFCFHLNDARNDLGSRLDGHEVLGKGKIGKLGMSRIARVVGEKGVCLIIETRDDEVDYKRQVDILKELFLFAG